ncbi:MAG: hypothetical protein L3J92_00245 [Thermoplasmata archaeon]|jgi:hypothetical protein|nr:hypothetical protein [Thermoplasmata archaeon]
MRVLRVLGVATMVTGLTIFVVGVFVANRGTSIVVSLFGVAIMLAGVAVSNHVQRSELGPGS